MDFFARFMGVPGEQAQPGKIIRPAGLRGVSSFDEAEGVKVYGIPRATGRSPVSKDVCYKVKIPRGSRGTTATLEKMAAMAVEASQDPGFVQEGRGIVRDCGSKDYQCEGRSIYEAVLTGVDYRNDPTFLEYVQSPGWTWFVEGQGDCDDQSTLVAGFDVSVGRGCRFGAYMLDAAMARAGEFSHVLCEMGVRTKNGVQWLGQDTVAKQGFGWTPPESEWYGAPNYLVVASP